MAENHLYTNFDFKDIPTEALAEAPRGLLRVGRIERVLQTVLQEGLFLFLHIVPAPKW